jgi:hypothetical protein
MSKPWFGGLPAAIDIRRLDESLGTLKVGDEITHEQVEGILGLTRSDRRYVTVTRAWRVAHMRDGREIGALRGIGFRVLNEVERVNGGWKGTQEGLRKAMRNIKRAVIVKTDDQMLVKKQDLLRRMSMVISSEATAIAREIEPPKAHQQAKRIPPSDVAG